MIKDCLTFQRPVTYNRYLIAVLILGFLVGGILFPTWQHAVESGQVIANVVKYPDATNPFYLYHKFSISFINYLSSFFIQGIGETKTCILLSGIQGALSYFSISFFLLPFFKKKYYLILLTPILIHASGIIELPTPYPIDIAGAVGYGSIAVSLLVISCGLLVNGNLKLLAINAGFITPIIHPTIGAISILIITSTSLIMVIKDNSSFNKYKFRISIYYFLLSLVVFVLCFIKLKGTEYGLSPTQTDISLTKEFISKWSNHHRDFPFTSKIGYLFIFYILFTWICLFYFQNQFDKKQFTTWVIIGITSLIGLLAALLSRLPTNYMPLIFWQVMPLRLPNLTIILVPAAALAYLMSSNIRLYTLIILAASILCRIVYHNAFSIIVTNILLIICSIAMLLSTKYVDEKVINSLLPNRYKTKLAINIFIILNIFLFLIWGIKNIYDHNRRGNMWEWEKESDFFDKLKYKNKGYVLTGGMELIQLKSRRPVFTTHAFNQALYLPNTWSGILSSYRNVYNLQSTNDLGKFAVGRIRPGTFHPGIYQAYWETRSFGDWITLKKQFNLSDIITYKGWYLDLPLIASTNSYLLYSLNSKERRTQIIQPKLKSEHDIRKAFLLADNNNFWETNKAPTKLKLKYPVPTKITGYTLTSGAMPESMPSSWIVEASTDGKTWITIDKQSNQKFKIDENKFYPLPGKPIYFLCFIFTEIQNSQYMRIYSLIINSNCSNNTYKDLVFGTCHTLI